MKLISFSNFIPEQIADTIRFRNYSGVFRQSHYCQYVQNFLSNVLEDPTIEGAVLPNSCDSARSAVDYLAESSGKYIYSLKHPTIVSDEAILYFAQVIREYKESLEAHFGQRIPNGLIMERTDLLRKRGKYLYDLYNNIGDNSYVSYIEQMNTMLSKPLVEWEKWAPVPLANSKQGKNVYLIGPFLDNPSILRQIEQSGLRIVGDNLTNSKRLAWDSYYCKEESLYVDIASHILHHQASPTIARFSSIWEKDFAEIKQRNVKGVIFLCQKFCEPYDYLYTMYKKRLQVADIPLLRAYISDDEETGNSLWETFAEII
ncbi:hypothetical protein SAMD00024442_18_48 [Candidatus Symbiothrix dinenymphae]|nr:hypothetical protein SAMD00024442_18_48 [Candidatus Symbiothrix dinenymphae]